MDIVIITGISGAGKSVTLNVFEDMGYYCMDNLPPALISNFVELTLTSSIKIEKLAVVVDIRGRKFFDDVTKAILNLKQAGHHLRVLFLDADDKILVKRYKELRRPHPLSKGGGIIEGILKEREILAEIKNMSDDVVDTGNLTLSELKNVLNHLFSKEQKDKKMLINIYSFGFKHGILLDADLVFDVRFIENPFYIEELKNRTGLSKEVSDFIFSFEDSKIFVEKVKDLISFLIPKYMKAGKNNLIIGIGCTGGKHRSVAISEFLGKEFTKDGELVIVTHRDEKLW